MIRDPVLGFSREPFLERRLLFLFIIGIRRRSVRTQMQEEVFARGRHGVDHRIHKGRHPIVIRIRERLFVEHQVRQHNRSERLCGESAERIEIDLFGEILRMIDRTRLMDRRREIAASDRRAVPACEGVHRIAARHGTGDDNIAAAVVERNRVRTALSLR